jgi:hypothetical protein
MEGSKFLKFGGTMISFAISAFFVLCVILFAERLRVGLHSKRRTSSTLFFTFSQF